MVVDLDGGVVAQFVAAHHLDVQLNGAAGHAFVAALVLVQGIGTGIDEVVERPSAISVPKALIDCLVADQSVLGYGHGERFSTIIRKKISLRKNIAQQPSYFAPGSRGEVCKPCRDFCRKECVNTFASEINLTVH